MEPGQLSREDEIWITTCLQSMCASYMRYTMGQLAYVPEPHPPTQGLPVPEACSHDYCQRLASVMSRILQPRDFYFLPD